VRHRAAVQDVGQPGYQRRPTLGELSSGQLRLRGQLSIGTQSGQGISGEPSRRSPSALRHRGHDAHRRQQATTATQGPDGPQLICRKDTTPWPARSATVGKVSCSTATRAGWRTNWALGLVFNCVVCVIQAASPAVSAPHEAGAPEPAVRPLHCCSQNQGSDLAG
jgi:hypothetical protein